MKWISYQKVELFYATYPHTDMGWLPGTSKMTLYKTTWAMQHNIDNVVLKKKKKKKNSTANKDFWR